jgi:hypothetical protein
MTWSWIGTRRKGWSSDLEHAVLLAAPAFPAADIEDAVVKCLKEHLAAKQDGSTTSSARLGDRGDLAELHQRSTCVYRKSKSERIDDEGRSIMQPTIMRAARSSQCSQQLTATLDTPLTWKDMARSSFLSRKN